MLFSNKVSLRENIFSKVGEIIKISIINMYIILCGNPFGMCVFEHFSGVGGENGFEYLVARG